MAAVVPHSQDRTRGAHSHQHGCQNGTPRTVAHRMGLPGSPSLARVARSDILFLVAFERQMRQTMAVAKDDGAQADSAGAGRSPPCPDARLRLRAVGDGVAPRMRRPGLGIRRASGTQKLLRKLPGRFESIERDRGPAIVYESTFKDSRVMDWGLEEATMA